MIGMNVVPLVILWLLRRKLPSIEAMQVASQDLIVGEAPRVAGSPDLESTIS